MRTFGDKKDVPVYYTTTGVSVSRAYTTVKLKIVSDPGFRSSQIDFGKQIEVRYIFLWLNDEHDTFKSGKIH